MARLILTSSCLFYISFLTDNGAVDFDEFLQMMKYNMSADPEQELRDVFGVFDMNEDGFITADELYEMMAKLGENITRVGRN